MKKIKKKTPAAHKMVPAFILGWTHGDPPPPGFLAAWFDGHYGGPLIVKFSDSSGHLHFDAIHTSWTARIDLSPSKEQIDRWQASLQWDHPYMGFVGTPSFAGQDRRDSVLHGARLARGVSLLTDGTTFDPGTGAYLNPSDWRGRELATFILEDHVQIERQDRVGEGRVWLHTRGLTKFGWDELEAFQSIGLTDQECRRRLLDTAEAIIRENRNLKVGEQIDLPGDPYRATAVRHRTDSLYGYPIAFREMSWP